MRPSHLVEPAGEGDSVGCRAVLLLLVPATARQLLQTGRHFGYAARILEPNIVWSFLKNKLADDFFIFIFFNRPA